MEPILRDNPIPSDKLAKVLHPSAQFSCKHIVYNHCNDDISYITLLAKDVSEVDVYVMCMKDMYNRLCDGRGKYYESTLINRLLRLIGGGE